MSSRATRYYLGKKEVPPPKEEIKAQLEEVEKEEVKEEVKPVLDFFAKKEEDAS